jgi:hypothetical protein
MEDLEKCCRPAGGEGEYCHPDGTCNEGLGCVIGEYECDSEVGLGKTCCLPAGGEKQRCFADHTCNAGLNCIVDEVNCWDLENDECCRATGAQGQPCGINDACNGNLICVSNVDCEAPDVLSIGKCCLEAGGPGQPCTLDHGCTDSAYSCVMFDTRGNIWYECLKQQSD